MSYLVKKTENGLPDYNPSISTDWDENQLSFDNS